jgi:hypothetical protein
MRDVKNWHLENGIATPFERIAAANNLLYGKSEQRHNAHDVKLDRRHSVRDANNVKRFFKRNKKKMKQKDYRKENDKPC